MTKIIFFFVIFVRSWKIVLFSRTLLDFLQCTLSLKWVIKWNNTILHFCQYIGKRAIYFLSILKQKINWVIVHTLKEYKISISLKKKREFQSVHIKIRSMILNRIFIQIYFLISDTKTRASGAPITFLLGNFSCCCIKRLTMTRLTYF